MTHAALHRPSLPRPAVHRPLTADQLWAVATAALALVTVALALAGWYDAGIVAGALTVVCGGWSQMVSRTTAERFDIVAATVVGAVALAYAASRSSGLFT